MIPAKEFDGELWIKAADIHLLARDWPRTWAGLTNEEKSELWEISRAALPRYATYASLVEAKLREKNT